MFTEPRNICVKEPPSLYCRKLTILKKNYYNILNQYTNYKQKDSVSISFTHIFVLIHLFTY